MKTLKITIEIPSTDLQEAIKDAFDEIQSETLKLISRISDKHMLHMDDHVTMVTFEGPKSIQLDFVYNGPRPESTEKVKIELLQEEGPAGGNPLYKLTGEPEDLRDYLISINYAEGEDLEFYLK